MPFQKKRCDAFEIAPAPLSSRSRMTSKQLRFELKASACNQGRLKISRYARELVSKCRVIDDTLQWNQDLIEPRLERRVDGTGIDRSALKVPQSIQQELIAQFQRFGLILRRQVDRHIVAKPATAHFLR
jgi:hypothetical protein